MLLYVNKTLIKLNYKSTEGQFKRRKIKQMLYILHDIQVTLLNNPIVHVFNVLVLIDKIKRLSQQGSSNFCPELRKNSLLISQSYFSNFALYMISKEIG